MKITKIFLVLTLSFFVSLPFCFGEKAPDKLDHSHVGPASEDNPLFENVLSNPVVDGEWIKVGENAYIGPSEDLYIYDSRKGEMNRGGETNQVGQYTYDDQGNVLRRVKPIRDVSGNVTGYNDYSGYVYDNNGKLTDYSLIKRDENGSMIKGYTYSDRIYDENGKITHYVREDIDAFGKKTNAYEFDLNENGKYDNYTRMTYDENEQVSKITDYDNFTYDENGNRLGCSRIEKDPSGNIVKSYEYSDYLYSGGQVVKYSGWRVHH